MGVRALASALTICLALAGFGKTATAAPTLGPSMTAVVTARAIGSGTVDSNTIKVNCTVYSPDNDDDGDDDDGNGVTPTGYVYVVGVRHMLHADAVTFSLSSKSTQAGCLAP